MGRIAREVAVQRSLTGIQPSPGVAYNKPKASVAFELPQGAKTSIIWAFMLADWVVPRKQRSTPRQQLQAPRLRNDRHTCAQSASICCWCG
jgi:hypothetical protein